MGFFVPEVATQKFLENFFIKFIVLKNKIVRPGQTLPPTPQPERHQETMRHQEQEKLLIAIAGFASSHFYLKSLVYHFWRLELKN
jgi:hypothetical protein